MHFFLLLFLGVYWYIILFLSDYRTYDEFGVGYFFLFDWYREFCRPFLGYLLHIFLGEFLIALELFLVFIPTRDDVNEVPVYVEFHKWPEPMECIRCHAREGFNGPLQLQVIGLEHHI
jgi:hypothetical protein